MKKLFFCIAIFFVFSINNAYCNNIEKIDSLFAYHIKSLNDTISKYGISDEQKICISENDRKFVEMVDFIADFKFDFHGYTLQPMINRKDVKAIKRWYKKNRHRLNISKIEQYLLLKEEVYNTYKSMDPNDFLNDNNAVDKVFDKIDSLKKVSTYIK